LTVLLAWTVGIGRGADNAPAADAPTKPKAADSGEEGKLKGRLPAYFAKLVDKDQKEAIYKIEDEYGPKIKALQQQVHDMEAERNGKIRAVLTPDQQKKLDEYMAAAKAAKSGKPAKESGDTKPKPTEPSPKSETSAAPATK
jgi:hypothetical protein